MKTEPKSKTRRIDIIEDNKKISQNVMKYISFHDDFEVGKSFGSAEAFLRGLEKDRSDKPDILLLDIGLPGISGLEALPKLREQMPNSDIIMLTTYEEEEKILKAMCSGACSYISKKESLKTIIEAIRIVANGGSYMSPNVAREIVKYLVGERKSKASILTARQREILELLVKANSYKKVAEKLNISVETVRTHIKSMYRTLEVNNKTEAIAMYLRGEIK